MDADSMHRICAHGVCQCEPAEGETFCSPYCEQAGSRTNVTPDASQQNMCDCGHPACIVA